jgi:MFS family permease
MPTPHGTFASLSIRNYRLYFFGQLVSLSGTWMQTVARAWLVLHVLDGGAFEVGVVTALEALPTLVLGAWAGVVADRVDKRRGLMVTGAVMGVLAATMAVLTLTGAIELWMVCLLALGQGTANMIDLPMRQTFVGEMVPPPLLTNGIALSAALFNAARVLGPAVGGMVIVGVGTGACFALNALTYMAVIGSLWLLDPADLHRHPVVARAPGQVREALRYVRASPGLRGNLALTALVMTVVNATGVVLPVLADDAYDGSAGAFSAMTVAVGLGAIVGALIAAGRSAPTQRVLVVTAGAFGLTMLAAGAARTLVVLLPLLVLSGVASIAFASTSMAKAQLESEPSMRGRVLALRLMTVVGTAPLAAPLVGWLAEVLTPRWALALMGLLPLAGAAAYAARSPAEGALAELRPAAEGAVR